MIKNLVLIGLGGAVGSMARYLCQKWFASSLIFPWGTFLVNVLGCFLLGLIYAIAERSTVLTPSTRLLLITGLCGGFTTFSTFAFENYSLLRSVDMVYFFLYSIGSLVIGIAGVYLGIMLVKTL